MVLANVRNFGRVKDALEIPDLLETQRRSYGEFLQVAASARKRKDPQTSPSHPPSLYCKAPA